jgi:hypothetical protein
MGNYKGHALARIMGMFQWLIWKRDWYYNQYREDCENDLIRRQEEEDCENDLIRRQEEEEYERLHNNSR